MLTWALRRSKNALGGHLDLSTNVDAAENDGSLRDPSKIFAQQSWKVKRPTESSTCCDSCSKVQVQKANSLRNDSAYLREDGG